MSKVYHGEFRAVPAATVEFLTYFSNLHRWVTEGELKGRFIFDMGQALYEDGRPRIGMMMMQRGRASTDLASEGYVSEEVVRMRLAMDYPVVPDTFTEIVDAYFNMTSFLSATSAE